MSKLIDINLQIEKLQKQADEIRSKEYSKTVQEIVSKMTVYGITLQDIKKALEGNDARKGTKVKKATGDTRGTARSKLAGSKVEPKYRGPNGETWTGRGVMPRWMTDLVNTGRTKEEFEITKPQ